MKYPIGIQDFESLITGGYTYVDKTALIYEIATQGSYYFLSRPRRFGKSLLLSTLKQYFLGRKDLFKGLAIENLEKEWKEYPVLYIDINTGKYTSPGSLEERLDVILSRLEEIYGCTSKEGASLSTRFENLIIASRKKMGRKAVILVDEYDKPLLQTINDPALQSDHRATLKAFYSVLKSQDANIRLAFLTGVSRFSKVSIFSDLNNLQDISMSEKYSQICGITQKELLAYFNESIKEMAKANKITKKVCLEKLKAHYDGYHFEYGTVGLYNPFSLLNALSEKRFNNYWFATGTPTVLVESLKRADFDLENLTDEPVTAETLGNIDLMWENPKPLLYQSGYLTIGSYNRDSRMYLLDYPNVEVKEGLLNFLIPNYTPRKYDEGVNYIYLLQLDLKNGDVEGFISKLKAFFDTSDYRIAGKAEKYFHNAMCIVLRLLGIRVETEVTTSRGRIDAVIRTANNVYLIEFKLGHSAEEALAQIQQNGYPEKFSLDSRSLYALGVNFSEQTRSIEECKYVKLK